MRLFWALVPPAEAVAPALDPVDVLRDRWPALRWVAPRSWHVTLAFLGSVDEAALGDLVGEVGRALEAAQPVEVAVAGRAGTPGGRAGVVWLPTLPDRPDDGLAVAVQTACRRVTDVEDRPWRGHLTLARTPRGPDAGRLAGEVAAGYEGPPLAWTADAVTLLHSRTGPDGAAYTPLAEVPLGR